MQLKDIDTLAKRLVDFQRHIERQEGACGNNAAVITSLLIQLHPYVERVADAMRDYAIAQLPGNTAKYALGSLVHSGAQDT